MERCHMDCILVASVKELDMVCGVDETLCVAKQ